MTDHTLTNDDCLQILRDVVDYWDHEGDPSTPMFYELMRTAERKGRADMLEQVIEWLDSKLHRYTDASFHGVTVIDYDNLFKDLKEAMRPQEDN